MAGDSLTANLRWQRTALQLSENITLFAIRGTHTSVIGKEGQMKTWPEGGGVTFIYVLYHVGDRTESWGTSACISLGVEILPSSETLNFLCERKELISLIRLAEKSNLYSLHSKTGCLVVSSWRQTPSGSWLAFFFQLNTCFHSPYVISSLTRGWVCRLQLLLVLASAVILSSESRGTHDHILLSQIRDSPNLEDQVPIFIPPGTEGPS
jgi:hypothetical protein